MEKTRFVAGPDRGIVTLNGDEIQDVVECDTLHGFVIQVVRGADGKLYRQMLIGHVTFIPAVSL